MLDGFDQAVNEHRRCRRFQIISFSARLIQNLIPQTGILILIFRNRCCQPVQNANNHRSLGMARRQEIQQVDQGHGVPAHSPAPKVGRCTSDWICPALLPAFVPTVIKQASLFIAGVFFHENDLVGDVVK